MKHSAAVLLLLVSALTACREDPAPPATPAAEEIPQQYQSRAPEPDVDSDNLLNIAYGASVVSRTSELNLESSAAHAIDGMLLSGWVSAPGAREESLVFSLLAPTRVLRVGITGLEPDQRSDSVRFEGSMNGVAWKDLATVHPEEVVERQLAGVTEAAPVQFVRVTAKAAHRYYVSARALHVLGQEVAPPTLPPFTGCWESAGVRLHLTQNAARITGHFDTVPPTYVEGGTDNRVALLMWTQGATWGYTALTRTPGNKQLTAFRFYDEVDSKNAGEAWFGEKCHAGTAATGGAAADARTFLARAKRYSVFGLVFDGNNQLVPELSEPTLDALVELFRTTPQQRYTITSRSFRGETAAANTAVSAARLAALRTALQQRGADLSRMELVATGDRWIGPPLGSTIQAMLATRIDIDVIPR